MRQINLKDAKSQSLVNKKTCSNISSVKKQNNKKGKFTIINSGKQQNYELKKYTLKR